MGSLWYSPSLPTANFNGRDPTRPLATARRQECIDAYQKSYLLRSALTGEDSSPSETCVSPFDQGLLQHTTGKISHCSSFCRSSCWLTKGPLRQKLHEIPRDETRDKPDDTTCRSAATRRTKPRTGSGHPSSRSRGSPSQPVIRGPLPALDPTNPMKQATWVLLMTSE